MKTPTSLGLSLALVTGLGQGCVDPEPSTPETSPTEETEEAKVADKAETKEPVSLHAHMQEHFVRVDEMRLAVVEGDLEEAKSKAKWMANHPPHDDLPKGWEPYVEMMRDQSRKVLEEENLAAVALSTARVAGTCGSCHMANKAKVHLGAAPEPENHKPLEHHMWAAERLWDAVVSQSDELWKMGVASLDGAAVLPPDMESPPPSLAKAKTRFASFQAAARKAESPSARVEVLGSYLGQCVGCHQEAKRAPDAF